MLSNNYKKIHLGNCFIQQLHKITLIICKTCTNRYMRNHELSETDIQPFDCVIRDLLVT